MTCSSVLPIQSVWLRPPGTPSLLSLQEAGWKTPICLDELHQEFNTYHQLLQSLGIEVNLVPSSPNPDSIYLYDVLLSTPWGFVILQSRKKNRTTESTELRNFIEKNNLPILGNIKGNGYIDGGDLFWIHPHLLAMGLSWRSNIEGAKQLRKLLSPYQIQVEAYDLPNLYGQSVCLHLMSLVSPIHQNLALVCETALPIRLHQALEQHGYTLLSVPPEEWESLGSNVLALGHRRVISLAGNPQTKKRLQKAGIEVIEFHGPNLCLAGTGGPTCLTMVYRRA